MKALLNAPSGASETLTRALDLADGGVQSLVKRLDLSDRNLFWTELERFASMQIGHKTTLPLVVGEPVPIPIRETLRETESKITKVVRSISASDRDDFWVAVRNSAAEQTTLTGKPKVRAGGGPFPF